MTKRMTVKDIVMRMAFRLVIGVVALVSQRAFAAEYQWDPNGASAGLGGTAAWSAAGNQWDLLGTGADDGTDATVAYQNLATVTNRFGGTAGTVSTVPGGTHNSAFAITTGGYIFTAGGNYSATFNGPIAINASGTTTFINTGNNGRFGFAGGLSITNGATLTVSKQNDAGNGPYLFYDITGSGTLNIALRSSTSGFRFNNATTFSGQTVFGADILYLKHYSALAQSTLVMNRGSITFEAGTGTYYLGALAGTQAINMVANTLNVGGNLASTTYAGALSGTGGIIKNGTGILTLSGDSSFSGGLTLNDGVIEAGQLNSLGTNGPLTIAGGVLSLTNSVTATLARGDVTLASGGLRLKVNALSSNAGCDLIKGAAVTGPAEGATFNFLFDFKGTGTAAQRKYKVLTGNFGTAFPTNRLTATVVNGPPAPDSYLFTVEGSALYVTFTGADYKTTYTWAGAGSAGNWNTTEANWRQGETTGLLFADGIITEFENVAGQSAVTLSVTEPVMPKLISLGNNAMTYSFVKSGSGALLGDGTILSLQRTTNSLDTALLGAYSGTPFLDRQAELAFTGTNSLGLTSLTFRPDAKVVIAPEAFKALTVNLDFSGEINPPATATRLYPIFQLSGNTDPSTVDVPLSSLAINFTKGTWGADVCEFLRCLRVERTIYAVFKGSAYANVTTLHWGSNGSGGAGTLTATNWYDPFTGENNQPISYGNTLIFDGGGTNTVALPVTATYPQLIGVFSGTYTFDPTDDNGDATFSSTFRVAAGASAIFNNGNSSGYWDFKFTGVLDVDGNVLVDGGAGPGASGSINSLSGTGVVTLRPGRECWVSGNNTNFTGKLNITDGTIFLSHTNAAVYATVEGTPSFGLSGPHTYNIGALTGSGNIPVGTNILSVGALNTNTLYSGVISGSGGVTKVGSGTLTLKGTNLFTGTFTLQGGTVVAGNTQALGVGVLDVTGASALAMSYRSPLAVTVGTLGAVLTLSVDGTGAQVPLSLIHI